MTICEALTETQRRIICDGMKDKNRTIDKELEDLDTIAEITLLKIKYKPINAKNPWRFMKGDGLNDQTGLYLWTWRSR